MFNCGNHRKENHPVEVNVLMHNLVCQHAYILMHGFISQLKAIFFLQGENG